MKWRINHHHFHDDMDFHTASINLKSHQRLREWDTPKNLSISVCSEYFARKLVRGRPNATTTTWAYSNHNSRVTPHERSDLDGHPLAHARRGPRNLVKQLEILKKSNISGHSHPVRVHARHTRNVEAAFGDSSD